MSKKKPLDPIIEGLVTATREYFAGKTSEGIQTLLEAEQAARAARSPHLAYVLIQKASWLRELGRTDEAASALREAEALCKEIDSNEALLAGLHQEQGIVATQAGEFEKAEALLNDAKKLAARTRAGIVMMSDILANLATIYIDQGRLADAQATLSEAIEHDEKTKNPRALSGDLNMLGQVYMAMNDYKTARIFLTRSRDIAAEAGLDKELWDAIGNLAIVSQHEGADDAETLFRQSLDAAVKAGRLPEIASNTSSLGILARSRGDFKKSYELFEDAYRIHSQLNLAEFSTIGLINLAQTALSLKKPRKALQHATAALKIAEERHLVQLLWVAHYLVAKSKLSALRVKSATDAETVAVFNEIMEHYVKAADAIELMRSGIGRPAERGLLLLDKEEVYQDGMLLAGSVNDWRLAWSFAERSRARSFLDSLGAVRIAHHAETHPLAARRSALIRHLLEIKEADTPEAKLVSEELGLLRARIIAEAPAVAAVTEAALPKIEEVIAAIPPNTVIVEFFLGPGNLLTAFVLAKRGAMSTIDLGANDLLGKIQEFRAEVQFGVPDEPAGALLFKILLGPIWKWVEPFARLLIVPHGALHYLPFAALWFHSSDEDQKKVYLCQRFQISILPSAACIQYIQNFARPAHYERSALILGNPTMDLPASVTEAAAIAKLFDVTPLIGSDAQRERVLSPANEYGLIHIASHGVYDERDPLLSGVLLADGRLSVEDLLEARIAAGLLTLSGCLTGSSMLHAGDELIGLSRAALAAGIPSVITTLWEVQDDVAAEFFERFYLGLSAGMEKVEALCLTQHSMIEDDRYKNSSNWAPYVLLGDWR